MLTQGLRESYLSVGTHLGAMSCMQTKEDIRDVLPTEQPEVVYLPSITAIASFHYLISSFHYTQILLPLYYIVLPLHYVLLPMTCFELLRVCSSCDIRLRCLKVISQSRRPSQCTVSTSVCSVPLDVTG